MAIGASPRVRAEQDNQRMQALFRSERGMEAMGELFGDAPVLQSLNASPTDSTRSDSRRV